MGWIPSYSQYTREQKEYIANKIIEGNACKLREQIKDSIIINRDSSIFLFNSIINLKCNELSVKDTIIAHKNTDLKNYQELLLSQEKYFKKKILLHKVTIVGILLITSYLILKS